MSGRVAGITRRPEAVLHVDYEAVLRQAVANERYRTLQEVRRAVDAIAITEAFGRDTWNTRDRSGQAVKTDVRTALDRIEANS